MDKKIEINIVYSPATDPQHKVFENEHGIIFHDKNYDPDKINIGMGWYSIRNPNSKDSILVVEPYCVLQRDYEINFVKKFKHIFTWATEAMTGPTIKNKVVPINHPTYLNIQSIKSYAENWPSWDQRKNEIVIIANNKSSEHYSELYSLRICLADMLHDASSYEVSWYGQISLNRPYYKGPVQDKEDILKKAKFSICTENSYDNVFTHNYFTEKMPDVWRAGSVPIYMGCFNIDDMGTLDGCYIDLRPLVEKHEKSWKVNKTLLNNKIVNYTEEQYKNYIKNLYDNVDGA